MSKVFISYRREDAAGYAQAIYSELEKQLPRDKIFMDVDAIEPGVDFVEQIEKAVSECEVVIALVGKRWFGEQDNAPPRIHDEQDFVRLEIAAALSLDIRVIPVLVDGATMPRVEALPAPLQPLVRRNALEISNTRFRYDIERVAHAVQNALGQPGPDQPRSNRLLWYGGIFAVVAVLGFGVFIWVMSQIKGTNGEEQIIELLNRANIAVNEQRLTEPEDNNAVKHFREVLELDPNNRDAQEGLRRVGQQYLTWAEQAIGQRQFDKAVEYLEKAAAAHPEHPALADLRKLHEDARTKVPRLEPGQVFRDRLKIGGEGPAMVVIPAGNFEMGNIHGNGQKDELPVHGVRITRTFAMGQYEVTFEDYDRYAIAHGIRTPPDEGWGRGKRPVINVSWRDSKAYAKWLSDQTGKRYRLLSEAEWEYAARSISEGKDEMWSGTSEASKLKEYAVFSKKQTEPVGSPRQPNSLGLFDMSGNVWEWVEDCWHGSYEGAPKDGSAWLEANGGNCGLRVIRGGSWFNDPGTLRTSPRGRFGAGDRYFDVGFRLAQDLE